MKITINSLKPPRRISLFGKGRFPYQPDLKGMGWAPPPLSVNRITHIPENIIFLVLRTWSVKITIHLASEKPRDCADIQTEGFRSSGVFNIYPEGAADPQGVEVFCDLHTEGGGWLVSTFCDLHTEGSGWLVSTFCGLHTEGSGWLVSTFYDLHTEGSGWLVSAFCDLHGRRWVAGEIVLLS